MGNRRGQMVRRSVRQCRGRISLARADVLHKRSQGEGFWHRGMIALTGVGCAECDAPVLIGNLANHHRMIRIVPHARGLTRSQHVVRTRVSEASGCIAFFKCVSLHDFVWFVSMRRMCCSHAESSLKHTLAHMPVSFFGASVALVHVLLACMRSAMVIQVLQVLSMGALSMSTCCVVLCVPAPSVESSEMNLTVA